MTLHPPSPTLFPYTTLFRSEARQQLGRTAPSAVVLVAAKPIQGGLAQPSGRHGRGVALERSEEHTSELQSPCNLVCRLLLEKKKNNQQTNRFNLKRERIYGH